MLIFRTVKCEKCGSKFSSISTIAECSKCKKIVTLCESCKNKGCDCGGKFLDVWNKDPGIMY